ncbi:transposase [Streptomyces sp. NRRL B-3648]|uniref:transposase n=1 Tax=Streptomyces sp. NRRL B-3648 TaxID=1519493 RepID=UPI00099C5CB6
MFDATAFKYRTGTPWRDLPGHFGSWKGTHNRLREWAADGTWEQSRSRSSPPCSPRPAPKATWTGSSRSIPRPSEPTSTPAGALLKGAPAGEPDNHAPGRPSGG